MKKEHNKNYVSKKLKLNNNKNNNNLKDIKNFLTQKTTTKTSIKKCELKSISTMVDRFVQSISQINDSGSFDTSLEVKYLQSPQRIRHRCVTELDREDLMKFVRDLELKQSIKQQQNCNGVNSNKSTPKNSPFFCRKAKAIYQNAFVNSRSTSPKLQQHNMDSDIGSSSDGQQNIYEDIQVLNTDVEMSAPSTTTTGSTLQRAQSERSSYRTLLQFFSAKKKLKPCKASNSFKLSSASSNNDSSCNSSTTASPIPFRAVNGIDTGREIGFLNMQRLPTSDVEDENEVEVEVEVETEEEEEEEEEPDDGISTASSNFTQSSSNSGTGSGSVSGSGSGSGSVGVSPRNYSPDSSFEMHAPLVPTFKVTPPQITKSNKNAAYEFARFLRSSFNAKRATITTLRRSISDPDTFKNFDFTKKPHTQSTTSTTTPRCGGGGGGVGGKTKCALSRICNKSTKAAASITGDTKTASKTKLCKITPTTTTQTQNILTDSTNHMNVARRCMKTTTADTKNQVRVSHF